MAEKAWIQAKQTREASEGKGAPRGALIVIGDEILSGKFADENSPWLLKRCRELGVDIKRVEVVPDEVEVIAQVVRRWSEEVDWVFTSGGVGPTHDDKTMEGIASAFNVPLSLNTQLDSLLRAKMGVRYNDAAARMATIPEGSELWEGGPIPFPQVVFRNVFIFPGVPSLFRHKFDAIAERLGGKPISHRRITTLASEPEIAELLDGAQERWKSVAIGSYPQFDNRPWTVTITLDSRDLAALSACHQHLLDNLTELGIVSENPN
jgi:molybdenum cofactor synthesis domain-containing protein